MTDTVLLAGFELIIYYWNKSVQHFTLLQLGHPHLRLTAKTVKQVTSDATQQLIDDLLRYVEQVQGMGIAAPQADISQRLFIMSSKPNNRYPYAPLMEPTAVINPQIISASTPMVKDWEGCLSVPGFRALVPRHQTVMTRYTDRSGQQVDVEYSGFLARVFQHELDHLNGLIYLDRVENNRDIVTEQEWLKQIDG